MAVEGAGQLPIESQSRFVVTTQTNRLEPKDASTVVEMHSSSLDRLDLFNNDWVLLKGKKRRATVMMVEENDDVGQQDVAINDVQRRNLNVRPSDFVTVEPANPQNLRRVQVAPIAETVEGISGDYNGIFLVPYFTARKRVVRSGDLFMCRGAMKEAWFKVLEVEAGDGKDYGIVNAVPGPDGTELQCLEKITREEGEQDLNAVGYEDIGGLGEQIQTIRETVELPLRHPRLFRTLGVRPPKGVLMHGPPGTGKTLIARAIANETGSEIITINGPEIMSGKQGGSEKNLRDIFQNAEEIAAQEGNNGAIIFIDEIDAIAPSREKTQDEKLRRVVATLLTLMDGVKQGSHIMVIGATNRPNSLDSALRRAGRFDTELVIPVPSQAARVEILNILTRKMKLADDVDVQRVAEVTHGYVGADLSALCMKAAVSCIRTSARGLMDMDEEDIPAEFLDSLAVTMHDFLSAMDSTTASSLRDVVVETPNVSFKDIGGLEDVKQRMQELVEMPVRHPEYFEELGMAPPSGALMFGPPGCGKTLVAKAMANECEANFISIKGPQMLSKWFGESEEHVRETFEKARQASPCILFFDELDSIARARGGFGASSAGGASDRVVNELLTELDGVGERKNVFVIGATNRPDTIDPALRRPGRLDQLLYIPMPDGPGRRAIFKAALRRTRVARTVDIDRLADTCENFTGSDVASVCQMAIKISVRDRLSAMMEAYNRHGGRNKAAVEYSKEQTANWAVTAECFERARSAVKASVTEETLRGYIEAKERLEAQTGGRSAEGAAVVPLPAAGFATSAGGVAAGAADDDDLYDA